MKKILYAALVVAAAALAGCGKGKDEARFDALCAKAGMTGEALRLARESFAEASSAERGEMLKNLQKLVDNPPVDEDAEDGE